MEKNTMQRKTYSKPCVEFVDFSLSGSIAASCVYRGNHDDGNSCSYEDNGWNFFSMEGICEYQGNGDFCYHVPTVDNSIFGS